MYMVRRALMACLADVRHFLSLPGLEGRAIEGRSAHAESGAEVSGQFRGGKLRKGRLFVLTSAV